MNQLEGMTAIVTGATRGIGLAIATAFVGEGASVVLTGRSVEEGRKCAADLGAAAHFIACDLTRREQLEELVAKTDETFGRIDILVNNAGDLHRANVLDLPLEEYERIHKLNLTAPFLLTQLVGRIMVRQRSGGSIINITSVGSVLCRPGGTTYHVTKAGLAMLTRSSALDLGQYGIRVNAIAPGTFATELMLASTSTTPGLIDNLVATTPLGRLGELKELASVATFLAGRESSYVTGQSWFVDGGRTVLNPSLRAPASAEWLDFRR
jgi:Dehydrogenases with different specificities (related to short-chain alcohol dehydrogenases)